MQQIVDLQNDADFQKMNIALLSIAFDSAETLSKGIQEYGIQVPMLTDTDHKVSEAYGVLQWAVATGEPGHTFVLINEDGDIVWIQDYGAPENGGRMYVPIPELLQQIQEHFGAS